MINYIILIIDWINKKNWLLGKYFILRLESFKNVYNLHNTSCFKSSTIVLYAIKFEENTTNYKETIKHEN